MTKSAFPLFLVVQIEMERRDKPMYFLPSLLYRLVLEAISQ